MQKIQRNRGISFVSRTQLNPLAYERARITVFRVVLANPLTTMAILERMLEEQREIALAPSAREFIDQLDDPGMLL